MHYPNKHDLLLFLVLYATTIFGQSDSSLIQTAGIIEFETKADSTPRAINSFLTIRNPERLIICAPPYRMFVFGNLDQHSGYQLVKAGDTRSFYCLPDEHGITFLPVLFKQGSGTSMKPSGKVDTLLGYPVTEHYYIYNSDTIRHWITDSTTLFHGSNVKMGRMTLASTRPVANNMIRMKATNVQLLHLHEKYISPDFSHSPVTFETDLKAFTEMVSRLNAFFFPGILPQRRPYNQLRTPNEFRIGRVMPLKKIKSISSQEPVNPSSLAGKVNLFLFMDFTVLQPVPAFLSEWVTSLQTLFPDLHISIVSPSESALISAGLQQNPVLATLPQFTIPFNIYKRFEWMDPLSYVLTDRELRLMYKKSAFDLHSINHLEATVQRILNQ